MALTLAQGAQLVADASFISRVRCAMIKAAMNVSTEAKGTLSATAWVKRRQLANRILVSPDGYLGSFVAAVAADPGISLSWFAPVLIVSSTNANPVVFTTQPHGLATGDIVEILGHLVNTAGNGTWPVTVLSTTTFSVPWPGNGAGTASGTIQKQETDVNINFTVNSTVATNVFSAVAGLAVDD